MTGSAVLAGAVDQQKAAPLGLFVLILLGLACYFLFKSMSRHLRRVRDEFPAAGFAPTDGMARDGMAREGGGLTRPAPVTLAHQRLAQPGATPQRVAQPGLIGPDVGEPRAIEPRVIESAVIEPAVIQPAVIEPAVIEPENSGDSAPHSGRPD